MLLPHYYTGMIEAGCDEAGRGCLAGSVYAAAVILPDDYQDLPHTTIVKGDGKYLAIAAASVLAKTYRDDYMKELHTQYPYYGWDHNAGYPTKEHRQGIAEHGPSPYHRMTFTLLPPQQLELF